MTAPGFEFAWSHELRGADDDDVTHGAFDFIKADLGAAALAIVA